MHLTKGIAKDIGKILPKEWQNHVLFESNSIKPKECVSNFLILEDHYQLAVRHCFLLDLILSPVVELSERALDVSQISQLGESMSPFKALRNIKYVTLKFGLLDYDTGNELC